MSAPSAAFGARNLALRVYLLGTVPFENVLALQRQLVYEVSGDRTQAALILCEHPPLISVGREGSRGHIRFDPEELHHLRWPVRWVNRGGGAWLHLPGQLALYPILPLDQLGLGLGNYLDRLRSLFVEVLTQYGVPGAAPREAADILVGTRPIARLGVAVCDWVCYHGAILNIQPDLERFRHIRGPREEPMTSLERERRDPLRTASVRERLVEWFAKQFAFQRTSLFFHHPALAPRLPSSGPMITAG